MYALVGKIKLHRKNYYSPEVHGHIEYAMATYYMSTSLFYRVGATNSPSVSGTANVERLSFTRVCQTVGLKGIILIV